MIFEGLNSKIFVLLIKRLNDLWWELRNNLQGLDPAVAPRSVDNLDPLAKYHVAGDVPYIRYFVSFVTQFQFYEALCKKAGEYDPKVSGIFFSEFLRETLILYFFHNPFVLVGIRVFQLSG